MVLRPEQVTQWHERGFLVLDGIWPPELVVAAAAAAAKLSAPQPAEAGDPTVAADSHFPHDSSVLNDVVLHPRVLAMVRQLLGGPAEFYGDVLLKKEGRMAGDEASRGEQFAHLDMSNHTSLVVPPSPESVAIIISYSESAEPVGGPPCFLPDGVARLAPEGMPSAIIPGGMVPPPDLAHLFASDGTSTQLAAHELAVRYHPGVALVYRLDTCEFPTPVPNTDWPTFNNPHELYE